MSGTVHIMDHPLVAHKLTILRDKNTSVKDFREIVSEIGMLITYEATRDLPLTTKEVETPICKTTAPTLKGKKFAVVPILYEIAKSMLPVVRSNSSGIMSIKQVARLAVDYADALIELSLIHIFL